MKRKDKIFIALMATLMFFVSGGIACTYFSGVNIGLVATLGVLVFITAGYVACTIGANRIAKRKQIQNS